jgi:hypothetical protein
MEITLNSKTKATIARVTGIKYDEIISMDSEDLQKRIEKKIGKKLTFGSNYDKRLPDSRGSVYLYLNRLFSFDTNKLDKFIDSL